MATDPLILELRRVKNLRRAATTAQNAATKATMPAIVAALQAGISPSLIAAESGVSDSHVRAVRRAHDIPANPSYAHLRPTAARAAVAPTDAPAEPPKLPPVPDELLDGHGPAGVVAQQQHARAAAQAQQLYDLEHGRVPVQQELEPWDYPDEIPPED